MKWYNTEKVLHSVTVNIDKWLSFLLYILYSYIYISVWCLLLLWSLNAVSCVAEDNVMGPSLFVYCLLPCFVLYGTTCSTILPTPLFSSSSISNWSSQPISVAYLWVMYVVRGTWCWIIQRRSIWLTAILVRNYHIGRIVYYLVYYPWLALVTEKTVAFTCIKGLQ